MRSSSVARPRFVCLALALVTLLAYLPARRHGFILYDDPDYLTENRSVQDGLTPATVRWAFTTFHASNWHPLTWLSHALDCELFGLDPGAHHLVSALFHAVNAALLVAKQLRTALGLLACFHRAVFALLRRQRHGGDSLLFQGLQHLLPAGLRQMIRKESPVSHDHAHRHFFFFVRHGFVPSSLSARFFTVPNCAAEIAKAAK